MKKILIVDDTQIHIGAAKKQFAGNEEYEIMTAGSFEEAKQLICKERFDVVMTDVMMPAPEDGLGREARKYAGELMPMGLLVALLALSNGVEKIFMVSDMNHHDHPVAWALDAFPIRGEGKVIISNKMTSVDKGSYETVVNPRPRNVNKFARRDKSEEEKEFERKRDAGEIIRVKNWLDTLTETDERRGGEC